MPRRTSGSWLAPNSVFLVLATVFGLTILVANPPFQAPDEWEHFYRAFQLSEGTLVGENRAGNAGGMLPAEMGFAGIPMALPFHPERKMTRAVFVQMAQPMFYSWRGAPRSYFHFPHIVLYSPAGYVPQTAAVALGKLLHLGPLGLLYLARVAGLGACIVLGRAALRRTPVFGWSTLLLLLGPMSLYLMGSVAQDGILITSAALFAALVARLATDADRQPGFLELGAILILAALLPLAKFVYLPLSAIALFVVLPRLGSRAGKLAFGSAFAVFCLLPVYLWGRVILSIYTPGRTDIPTDPQAQILHMMHAPAGFLMLVIRTFGADYADIYQKFVGCLGWLDTPLPSWFYPVYGVGLLLCLLLESAQAGVLRWRYRLVFAGGALVTVFLTCAAIYAHWNPPGSGNPIDGLQGRYFLPSAVVGVLAFPSIGFNRFPKWLTPLLGTALGATSAAICLWAVVRRYYLG